MSRLARLLLGATLALALLAAALYALDQVAELTPR